MPPTRPSSTYGVPKVRSIGRRTPGSFALTTAADFIVELAETLKEMGLRPEQCHAEVGHGNLELSVGED